MDEPHLHCLLFLLGPYFAETYFPSVQLSYYYLKQPFLSNQQLKELQSNILLELRAFIAEKIKQNHEFMDEYKEHLSLFTKQLLPSNRGMDSSNFIKAKSKKEVNDAAALILALNPKHLSKLKVLEGCELSGSLRDFVWMHSLSDDNQQKMMNESSTNMMANKNASNIQQLILRILQTAARNMESLGYLLDKRQFEGIECMLNKFYVTFERYSYRLSVITIHLYHSLKINQFDGLQTVNIINNLIDGRMWDSNQCKTEALETISALQKNDDELYMLLLGCYKNASRNVQLLDSHKKINKNEAIPITLQAMLCEFYYHSFVCYLQAETLCYVWDQLFLCELKWDKLQQITIQMLINSDLKRRIMENNVQDAINLYNLVKSYLRKLTVNDLKKMIQ